MMRSQYAGPEDETYVEFTFSYRGEIYTVFRSPEYMREKKRGSGLVKASARVELTLPDGTAFRGKTGRRIKNSVRSWGSTGSSLRRFP